MNTKKNEITIRTSDVTQMMGMFLAERLLRKWAEDFVDEDTGQVVSIERKEILFERGAELDSHTLSEVNFHLQAGAFEDVLVSNQKRACVMQQENATLWQVTIDLNNKPRTLYLYANSMESAKEISTDYIEQSYQGHFSFKNVKKLDYSNLLPEIEEEEYDGEEELDVYKIEVEISEEDMSYKATYILKSPDGEDAKAQIIKYMTKARIKEDRPVEFELRLISAKTIPCHLIIDPEFSKEYLLTE